MIVERLTAPSLASREISRSIVTPSTSFPDAPVNCRVLHLAPGAQTAPHNHHDSEIWIVVAGNGSVSVDGEQHPLNAGDLVRLRPLSTHTVANSSETAPLTFVSVWWGEDMGALKSSFLARRKGHVGREKKEVVADTPIHLLLPAFPTPNGKLHLGHMAGPYVAADVLRRALLLLGEPTHTLLGSLGHMNHVAVTAAANNESYYDTAERITVSIKEAFTALDIEWDVFVEPRPSEHYSALTKDILATLVDRGFVYARRGLVHRRPSDGALLFEAQVAGRCPRCEAAASANDCENCGRFHDDGETVDGRCARSGEALELVSLDRYYLRLEALRPALVAFRSRAVMSPQMQSRIDGVLADPLPEVGITHIADYGIPVGVPGFEQQRINSYFEHAGRLLTAVQQLADTASNSGQAWRTWLERHRVELIPIFGFDNYYMRGILFPALLHAYCGSLIEPAVLVMNQFYLLDGKKFSTSRQHAVWADEFARENSSDAIRFHLSMTRPEASDGNFSHQEFRHTVASILGGQLEGWLASVQERLTVDFDGAVPEGGPWSTEAYLFYGDLLEMCSRVRRAYEPRTFSTVRACAELNHFIDVARRFSRTTSPLPRSPRKPREADTHMALELMAVRAVVLAVLPIMPRYAVRVLEALGESVTEVCWPDPPAFLTVGRKISDLSFDMFSPRQ